jgi:hypothetical protein
LVRLLVRLVGCGSAVRSVGYSVRKLKNPLPVQGVDERDLGALALRKKEDRVLGHSPTTMTALGSPVKARSLLQVP